MNFNDWWMSHHNDICHCKGTCIYRVFMQQESWAERKAVDRLLQFLKIEPHDEMPQEYLKHAEPIDVHSEGQDQASAASVEAD